MKDKKTGENSKTDILFVKVTDPRLMQTVFYLNLLEYKTSAIQYANMSEYCESFSKNVYLEVIEKDTLIKEDIKQKYRIQSKARRDDIKSFNEL